MVGLNSVHPEVVNLLLVKSGNNLTESARKDMMGSIIDLKLNYIMFKSIFDEMIVLHHNLTIGGGLLTPSVEHFDLFGNGEVATPFKFKPTSILQVNEVECHS